MLVWVVRREGVRFWFLSESVRTLARWEMACYPLPVSWGEGVGMACTAVVVGRDLWFGVGGNARFRFVGP